MDYNKLSKFILAFGLIVVCIGGFNFLSNLPVSAPETQKSSENTIAGLIARADQMQEELEIRTQNYNRSIKRGEAVKVIVAGVVVIFVAFAVMQSAKTKIR